MRRFCEQLGLCTFVLAIFWGCSGDLESVLGTSGRKALPDPGNPDISFKTVSSLGLNVDPKQVGEQTNWKAVALGPRHIIAFDAQGNLFAGVLPIAQHAKAQIHLVSVLSELPTSEDVKIEISATQACIGFGGGRLFCGPLWENPLQPVHLESVGGGGSSLQEWDLRGNALCAITTGGILACTRLSHDVTQKPRLRQESDKKQWLHVRVGEDSVCATHEDSSATTQKTDFSCGVLPKNNQEEVKLAQANATENLQWKKDGFQISGAFVCARTDNGVRCGLVPTGIEQSPKMSLLSPSVNVAHNNLFVMGSSPQTRVKVCVFDSQTPTPTLQCATLETNGNKLKTPVSLKQTAQGGPANVDHTKLYLEGNHVWIGPDGTLGTPTTRQGPWYSAHLGQGDLLQLRTVSKPASVDWSRVYVTSQHAYALQKSAASNAQFTLWAMRASLSKSFTEMKKPENESPDAWHYDPNNPSFAVSSEWACGLLREGTTSVSNSLWCWSHGKVQRMVPPAIPNVPNI